MYVGSGMALEAACWSILIMVLGVLGYAAWENPQVLLGYLAAALIIGAGWAIAWLTRDQGSRSTPTETRVEELARRSQLTAEEVQLLHEAGWTQEEFAPGVYGAWAPPTKEKLN